MRASLAFSALLGAGFGAGLWTTYTGLRPGEPSAAGDRLTHWWRRVRPGRRLAIAAAAASGAVALTGWPVAAPLAALAAWALPGLLGQDRDGREAIERIEAIASWTEQLHDTLSAAAGLEQTLLATAATAPLPIRTEVAELAERIRHGRRLPDALRDFQNELGDPLGDLVVLALLGAAGRQSGRLGELLAGLAFAAREQAQMRTRTAASRARVRTSVRIVVGTTLGMALGLVVLNRDYLTPFDGAQGQLVLLIVGGLFAAAFAWLRRIAAFTEPARLLADPKEAT
ncbi:type II secretion system F family protein [Kitasatospora viridis]|uniref:Flp pilus assembly protein TadB n=1 Tax=Kitasatospora viridis TaxID=281105 RepID=A0A561TW05_9ACTN|nr:type II secretion system F family protein [Kitasatospora viridis]TWF91288.1 Flp pilus assembly protein TadB [Kitasatospora viridis]